MQEHPICGEGGGKEEECGRKETHSDLIDLEEKCKFFKKSSVRILRNRQPSPSLSHPVEER
jgi:hypothetical protein